MQKLIHGQSELTDQQIQKKRKEIVRVLSDLKVYCPFTGEKSFSSKEEDEKEETRLFEQLTKLCDNINWVINGVPWRQYITQETKLFQEKCSAAWKFNWVLHQIATAHFKWYWNK